MLQGKESENAILHKQVQERSQQVEELEEEWKKLKSENGQLDDRSRL